MTKPKPRRDRPVQPKCLVCHHPKSFHGGGATDCKALGCLCPGWHGVEADPIVVPEPVSAGAG